MSKARWAASPWPAKDCACASGRYANGLVLMHGKKALAGAGKLYAKAASFEPRYAMYRLDVEAALAELE